MKRWIFVILAVASFCAWRYEKPAHWVGIPAAADPRQSADGLPAPFAHEGYTIKPLTRYAVKAVVLSRDRYRFDPGAKIAPVDLALGWGPMSVADVINELKVSQSGRFYEYAWKDEPPLDPAQIITHSANTHCLPKDDKVRRELLAVKRHDLVTLEGLLVEVQGPNNYRWRSSITRDDTRGGACEVLWVTSVKRQRL